MWKKSLHRGKNLLSAGGTFLELEVRQTFIEFCLLPRIVPIHPSSQIHPHAFVMPADLIRTKTRYTLLNQLTWQWKITMFNKRYIFKSLFFHCHVSFRGCTFLLCLPLWIFSCRCAFESLVPAPADCSRTRWSPCWGAQRSRPTGLMGWHDRCLLGFIVVPLPETNIFAPEKWMVGILSRFLLGSPPYFHGLCLFQGGYLYDVMWLWYIYIYYVQ